MNRSKYEALDYGQQREELLKFLADYWNCWGLADLEDEAETHGFFEVDDDE